MFDWPIKERYHKYPNDRISKVLHLWLGIQSEDEQEIGNASSCVHVPRTLIDIHSIQFVSMFGKTEQQSIASLAHPGFSRYPNERPSHNKQSERTMALIEIKLNLDYYPNIGMFYFISTFSGSDINIFYGNILN